MDLSTLSRQLNMSVHDLRDKMKQAGFRLSMKASKVDNSLAREIMRKLSSVPDVVVPTIEKKVTHISISSVISVKDLATKLMEPVTVVIKKLIENGVMATINEEVDSDTAAIVAAEFGVEVLIEATSSEQKPGLGFVSDIIAKEQAKDLVSRPPIVAVMGHVDHGKTTLLDAIRKTNVVATEAGAITQHIGAYQVEHLEQGHEQIKKITFLDTPGHEAFAAMRARGANVTDLIVLVVAADDSVKPQTVEVINRAKLTRTPMIIAINKIDMPGANPDKVRADLSALGVTVEDWGGTIPAIPLSAKTGEGIDKLLEIILLTAEVEELKANPDGLILGAIIESHLSRGQGPVATVLVQNGTLRIGDIVFAGASFGKIRTMEDALGHKVKLAPPSTPVQISGLSVVAESGDIMRVAKSLDEARANALVIQKQDRARRLDVKSKIKADPNKKELKLIIRADVQGSLGAITDMLSKIESGEVKLNIVDQAVAEISESDIQLAENTGSSVIGFHARVNPQAMKIAKQKNITIDNYEIIYELMEDITETLLAMMPIDIVTVNLGRAKIKAVFLTEKNTMIVGGEVLDGEIRDKKKFRILRDKAMIGEGKIDQLQQNKVDVNEVSMGKEFGTKVTVQIVIKVGDIIEIYDETVQKRQFQSI